MSQRPEPGAFRAGHVFGVAVRVHWSVLVIFALVAWGLAFTTFPQAYPRSSGWVHVLSGLVASVAFLLGLLAHEVSHAYVAKRHGIEVDSITLWMFGGVSQLRGKASSPGVELQVAGVGPLVSVLIGGGCGLLAAALVRSGVSGPVIGTLIWLAEANVVLAVFNAIPAAPLDGGRVLHAALWKWRDDSPWASLAAARAGRVFGVLLVVFGVWQFIATDSPTALWPALLGWFLARAASAEELQARMEKTMSLLSVGDVMSRHPDTVPAEISVAELIDRYIFRQHHSTFPTVQDGRVAGLVSLRLVKQVPVDARSETLVGDIAYPLDQVVVTHPDLPLVSLVEQLEQSPDPRALVFDQGRLVGVVTPTDLVRATRLAGGAAG